MSQHPKGRQAEERAGLDPWKAGRGDSLHLHRKHFLEVMSPSDLATLENSCRLPPQGFSYPGDEVKHVKEEN